MYDNRFNVTCTNFIIQQTLSAVYIYNHNIIIACTLYINVPMNMRSNLTFSFIFFSVNLYTHVGFL